MENISFKSRIRLVPPGEFQRAAASIGRKNFVDAPWTIKQSILANKAYTTDVLDCTVCGLTDGQKVLLNHICPTMLENRNFEKIANFIKEKIDLTNKDLQGFVLGSKPYLASSPDSPVLFDKFVKLLEKYNIPASTFKGGPFVNNVAYSSVKDEWLISNPFISESFKKEASSPAELFQKTFDNVAVSDADEICW